MSLGHGKIKMLLQEKEEGKKYANNAEHWNLWQNSRDFKDFIFLLSTEAYSRQS